MRPPPGWQWSQGQPDLSDPQDLNFATCTEKGAGSVATEPCLPPEINDGVGHPNPRVPGFNVQYPGHHAFPISASILLCGYT